MAGSRRILVVDDDPIARDVAGTSLRAQGYEVVGAARLQQALEAARTLAPHLILADVVLPDGTGEDLALALREEIPAHKRPVVILMSAFSRNRLAEQRAMRERTGAVAFLTKPFSVPALLDLVAQQLAGAAPAGAGERGPATPPGDAPPGVGPGEAAAGVSLFEAPPAQPPAPRHGAAPVTLEDPFAAALPQTVLAALVEAWRKRWTGTIVVRRGGGEKPIEKRLVLEHGQIIWATTTLADEKLGRILLRLGWLPRDQYEPTLQEAARTRRRHGEVLVEKGFLTPWQLQDALLQQVERIVVNTLAWPDGIYTLAATSGRLDTTQRLVASPIPRLVARALRETVGAERLDALLATAGTGPLARAPGAGARAVEELAPALEERPLIEALATPTPLGRLLELHPGGSEAARPLVATLLALRLVVPAGGAPASLPPRATPAEHTAPAPPVAAPTTGARHATDDAALRHLEAEAAFEAGRLATERGDLPAAAIALRRALDLSPDEGEYRAWAAFVQALAAREAFDTSLERVAHEMEAAAASTPTATEIFDLIERVIRLRVTPDLRPWT